MKTINANNTLLKIKELLDILSNNKTTLDLSICITKLREIIASANDPEIKIVLLGSFSDGKTSTVAGIMGEILDNMKIDSDESSDELIIYRPKGLKKGFVIVDTPGLFGTKERELDGDNVLFSDITNKYISEAHIVMYVTSAVAPVKDSHSGILKRVLRDLGKLDSTIFVLNKMDETGTNITNDTAYNKMAETKKKFLIDRLSSIISLTKQEAAQLKVVCISADPKRKGIENWLQTPEKYNKLSRIPDLNNALNQVVSTSDKSKLHADALIASFEDVIRTFAFIYCNISKPLQQSSEIFIENLSEMRNQLNTTRSILIKSKSEMFRQLDSYRRQLLSKISNCSYEEMAGILTNDIGVEGNNVTFFVVQGNTEAIVNECSLSSSNSLQCAWSDLESRFEKQDGMFKDLADKGISAMKSVNNKTVLAARDLFFKGYKFKPWGATKFANGIGKAAAGLQAIMVAVDLYSRYKRNKELKETKQSLTDTVSTYFADLFRLISTDDDYFRNFAPSFIDMQNLVDARTQECEKLKAELLSIDTLKQKVSAFYGEDIEYVDFEEL